jgi:hypothetical protein
MSIAKYPSKERVERDGYLVYAEGDDIPESDAEELARQGYADAPKKATEPTADKAEKPVANKSRSRRSTTKS